MFGLVCWFVRAVGLCVRGLTVGDLQLGLGDDAARDVERLAAVEAGVGPLHVADGQTAGRRHGQTAGGLWGL